MDPLGKFQIVVTYDPARDVLTERHTELGKGTTDVYQYSVQNGFLVMVSSTLRN